MKACKVVVGSEWLTSWPGRFTPGKEPPHPLNRKLSGPQRQFGRLGEKKNGFKKAVLPQMWNHHTYTSVHILFNSLLTAHRMCTNTGIQPAARKESDPLADITVRLLLLYLDLWISNLGAHLIHSNITLSAACASRAQQLLARWRMTWFAHKDLFGECCINGTFLLGCRGFSIAQVSPVYL
jgi:hypothetical protein